MKVYSCPAECPAPEHDYSRYDFRAAQKKDEEHQAQLKAWLKANGYPGKYTGEIYQEQIADGYACYMVADGKKSCLIHLPYGDGYNDPNVRFVPKAEIIKRIKRQKGLTKLFALAKQDVA